MESEITNAESGLELPLSEPHFDDESTVLSARRVVPLDEVPSYSSPIASRSTRKWMFAAVVLGALLLGVVGGASYYSYLNRSPAQPLVDLEGVASGVDAISKEPSSNNEARSPAIAGEVSNSGTADANTEVVKEAPASSNETRKPVARRVAVMTPSADDDEMLAREERRARKDARKRIRELEREGRNPRSRNDLTRIREIFEGPQKP